MLPPLNGVQEGDYSWGEGEGVKVGGRIREREGALVLEGFIGDRQISANIAAVDSSLYIFTKVSTSVCYVCVSFVKALYILTTYIVSQVDALEADMF